MTNRTSNYIDSIRNDAKAIYFAGLDAVNPGAAIKKYCYCEDDRLWVDKTPYHLGNINNVYVIGAGKASAPMAAAIEQLLGTRITRGLVNVKYHHTVPLEHIELTEAGHPLPDDNGLRGTKAILDILSDAGEKDLVICLISGGGSALLTLPVNGIEFKDKQETTRILLSCGARIQEMNAIRKHLSRVKGGRLAKAAFPAPLICLILSDVVDDHLDVIASGPTVPDHSTFKDCMEIIEKYRLVGTVPDTVLRYFAEGIRDSTLETPKESDPEFNVVHNLIIGNNTSALWAAKEKAIALGYESMVLSSLIEGETRDVARVHAAIGREIIRTGNPVSPPACILSGGETTVTLRGKGLGGRNQEFVLTGAVDIRDEKYIVMLSAGTDGTDGPTDAAGAIADTYTFSRAMSLGIEPELHLRDNDSYHFFESLGDLFITGPTNTNVMDLRIMLIKTK